MMLKIIPELIEIATLIGLGWWLKGCKVREGGILSNAKKDVTSLYDKFTAWNTGSNKSD